MSDLVERLRSSEPLPFCPYDSRSPEYWTAPDDKPCKVCGGLNDVNAPDLCRGADTRIMKDAANEIERLRKELQSVQDHRARVARNRDMWKAQCERQADQLRALSVPSEERQ